MASTFHVSVITPEKAVLEADAISAVVPAHDGELGILVNRAPLLYRLGAGLLQVDATDGKRTLFVAGGFVQMVDNRLTLLTEVARDPGQIDRAGAERALATALAMSSTDDVSYNARERAVTSARAQLRLTHGG
jgi:F-type H+-transporting ATPase subunit epsilon